jgi:thymidylate synthase (FAD)
MSIVHQSTVVLVDHMGDDIRTVNAARVSYDKESSFEYMEDGLSYLKETDARLIGFLGRNNHWTPFAHNMASFRITAPIFVARQLVKHQVGLVWNEVSRRYVDTEPAFYVPQVWRGRPENSKQGSSGTVPDDLAEGRMSTMVYSFCAASRELYELMLRNGVCPEQARMVLPQNMMTSWYWTGSLIAFARVYNLRTKPDAQAETRDVALKIGLELEKLWPVSWAELTEKDNG